MDRNDEGTLWVKMLKLRSGYLQVADTLPIHWTKSEEQTPNGFCDSRQDIDAINEFCDDGSNAAVLNSPETVFKHPQRDRQVAQPNPRDRIQDLLPSASDADDTRLCVVCMERPADLQLLPCRHDRFCRRCIVDTVVAQTRPAAPPPCPLCRSAFHTLVIARPA
jgi:hypothetical protein